MAKISIVFPKISESCPANLVAGTAERRWIFRLSEIEATCGLHLCFRLSTVAPRPLRQDED